MRRLLFAAVILATATASAGPFKESLSADDVEAITKAVQAKLPPVDKAAVTKCQPILDKYNNDPKAKTDVILDAARCFRAAGALGAAIAMLKTSYKDPARGKEPESLREAAAGEEAGAMYYDAASDYENYWNNYAAGSKHEQPDANTLMLRALCIRRQLGDEKNANSDYANLTRSDKKTKYDSKTMCDGIRVIVMPAK